MGHFNDHARQLARRRQTKSGAESLGAMVGLFGILFLPFWWIVKYSAIIMWWTLKLTFWFFFWPIKLFKK